VAHQVLDNVGLLLKQMFCFTVLVTYFLLVVYSLYRELKGQHHQTVSEEFG
jgi:hypothetical protein